MSDLMDWLMAAPEPWTRTRTLVDLFRRPEDDVAVRCAHAAVCFAGYGSGRTGVFPTKSNLPPGSPFWCCEFCSALRTTLVILEKNHD